MNHPTTNVKKAGEDAHVVHVPSEDVDEAFFTVGSTTYRFSDPVERFSSTPARPALVAFGTKEIVSVELTVEADD